MKKTISALAAALLVFSAAACAQKQNAQPKKENNMTKKTLVVYYSYSGNTKKTALDIQKKLNADIFEIETVTAYPPVYNEVTAQAKKEIADGFKPPIKNNVKNLGDYSVIIIGSPVWWGTVAPAVNTFIGQNDLSGKTVVPFVTHGGGGAGSSLSGLKKALPKSTVLNIGSFFGSGATSKQLDEWLKEAGILK